MVTFNRVILAGNLRADPETRFLPSGVAVTSFQHRGERPLQVEQTRSRKRSPSSTSGVREDGENCAEYYPRAARPGRGAPAAAQLGDRRRETEQDEVVADNVQFLGWTARSVGRAFRAVGSGARIARRRYPVLKIYDPDTKEVPPDEHPVQAPPFIVRSPARRPSAARPDGGKKRYIRKKFCASARRKSSRSTTRTRT